MSTRRLWWRVCWLAVRSPLPLLLIVQRPQWCVWWRSRVDLVAHWHVQLLAGCWWVLLVGVFGFNTVTLVLSLPALLVTGAGVGRVVYPHTARGRARSMYHPEGWASWRELREGVSATAARGIAVRTRPTVAARVQARGVGRPSAWLLARLPATECGTWLGRTAVGAPFGVHCYAPHEAVACVIAPPRSLKTAWQEHSILDHPGAVLSTQVRPETYRRTKTLRERRAVSGTVHLLDPEGLTGEPSTFRWSPVTGCRDPQVAMQRATALAVAADKPGEDGEWFSAQAAEVLQLLLLIADVTGRTMRDVARWASNVQQALKAVELLIQEHRDRVPPGWLESMVGVLHSDATKTRGVIMLTLKSAVGFMSDPQVAELCCPTEDDTPFKVRPFLEDRSTVYLIASEREYAKVGPLLAAFTSYLFEEAKVLAARTDGGRLDPPLLLSLDEVANTIPMPLDRWAAYAGGSGVHIVWSAQSVSQLRTRWGRDGADTVTNATTAKLIAGGLTVEDDLSWIAALSPTRTDTREGRDVEVPCLTAESARTIPRWHAALVAGTTPMTIVRIRPVWLRADVLLANLTKPVVAPKPKELAPVIALPGRTAQETKNKEVAAS